MQLCIILSLVFIYLSANNADHVLLALGMEVPQGTDVVQKRQLIADYLGCGETVV